MHFDQSSYFPANFTFLGYMCLVAGSVSMLTSNVVLGLPILIVALGLSFTNTGCSIEKKTISDYVRVLGLKFESPEPFQKLRKLICKTEQSKPSDEFQRRFYYTALYHI